MAWQLQKTDSRYTFSVDISIYNFFYGLRVRDIVNLHVAKYAGIFSLQNEFMQ